MQTVGRREPLHGELGRFYDAIENPRATRGELPILRGDELRSYLDEVRERALEVLDGVELESAEDPLLAGGFVYEMLIAHEHQHNETMLQLIQMVEGYEPVEIEPPPRAGLRRARRWSWSRVGRRRSAPAPAASPTTTSALATRSSWSRSGSTARRSPTAPTPSSSPTPAPSRRCTGRPTREGWWSRTAMGRAEPLDPDQPVVHVSWHEADAFARWAGKRLPTEQEWEAAAEGADRERANLDQLAFGCAGAGAYADAPSDCGAVQMLGDVWEWTSLRLRRLPGLPAPSPIASTPRSSSATPTRCCAAAPGRPAAT